MTTTHLEKSSHEYSVMTQFQFNRVLVKLSKEELEDRRSKFLKEGEEIDVNLICYPEAKIFKTFEFANVPDDD
jgi:hypothetical protein